MSEIDVVCVGADGGWSCSVRVREGGDGLAGSRTTDHEVAVGASDLPGGLGATDVEAIERLVRETFVFLLEREPADAILRRFDLGVVGRYFPEYRREIERRLAG